LIYNKINNLFAQLILFKYLYENLNSMNNYSISDLQQLSGIKAHTIRIWEQRYNALKPGRSEGNTRFYDDTQLRRLLNIVSLSEAGMKVSEVCVLPDTKLAELIEEKFIQNSAQATPQEYFVSQLIIAGMEFNERSFEKNLSAAILRYGIQDTYVKIIQPMLVRVGLMWNKDSINPAQEHFISNLIRQKLFSAIDGLPFSNEENDSWLLFLPANELHEIGILFVNYYIRSLGKKVIYLGENVPMESLRATMKHLDIKNMYFFLIHPMSENDTETLLKNIRSTDKKARIFVSGSTKILEKHILPEKTYWINDLEDLKNKIETV
jgi:DNA-binding transcriptional MerR regulator